MSNGLMYGGQRYRRRPYQAPVTQPSDVSSGLLALSSALGRVGTEITDLAVDYAKDRDDTLVLKAANSLMGELREQRQEYLKRKGTAADGLAKEAAGWITERVNLALENRDLTFRGKRNLHRASVNIARSELEILSHHEARQMAIGSAVNEQLFLERNVEQVYADPTNPNIVNDKWLEGRATVLRGKSRDEFPTEIEDEKLRDYRVALHAAQISGLIVRKDENSLIAARELLKRYTKPRGDREPILTAEVSQRLEAALDRVDAEFRGQERAVDANTAILDIAQTYDGLDAQLQAADEIDDPWKRDRVRAGLKEMHYKNRVSLANAVFQTQSQAFSAWDQNPTIETISPLFNPAQQAKMQAIANFRAQGKVPTTDSEAVRQLNNLMLDNPLKFMKTIIGLDYGLRLDAVARRYFEGLQAEMQAGGAQDKLARVRSFRAQVNGYLGEADIDPTADSGKEQERLNQFDDFLLRELNARGLRPDTVTREELKEIVRLGLLEGETRGRYWQNWYDPFGWHDPDIPFYRVRPGTEQYKTFYYEDIDPKLEQQIIRSLQHQNPPISDPTDQEIFQAYLDLSRRRLIQP